MNSKIKIKYPIAIQWKIAQARLQKKRNSIDGYLKSDTFDIPGTDVQYYVVISPNGMNENYRGQTWIFLQLCFQEKKEIRAGLNISIETANYSRERQHVYTESNGCGTQICTVDELFNPEKRFIVDDEMIITIEGCLKIEKEVPVKLCKLECSGNILGINLWNQENKDFTIVVDGKEITAHKLILSSRSSVFAAMFKPHTKEAQENKVVIPDFSFHIVETAIKLCYDSNLVNEIPIDDMIFLLQFFDKYDIQSFKTDVEKLMISEINESNVCRLANSAIISNAPNLQKKCAELLQQCFRENKLLNDFDILDKEFAYAVLKKSFFKVSC